MHHTPSAIVQEPRARNSFEIVAPQLGNGWGPEIATGVPRRLEAQPQEILPPGSSSVDSPPCSCPPIGFAFQRRYPRFGPLTGDGVLRAANRLLGVITAKSFSLNRARRSVASASNRRSIEVMRREFQFDARGLLRLVAKVGFPALNIRLAVVYSKVSLLIMNNFGAIRH